VGRRGRNQRRTGRGRPSAPGGPPLGTGARPIYANGNYGFVYHLDEAARAKEKRRDKILRPKYEMSLEKGGLTALLSSLR
jgi:hypothetical protein